MYIKNKCESQLTHRDYSAHGVQWYQFTQSLIKHGDSGEGKTGFDSKKNEIT